MTLQDAIKDLQARIDGEFSIKGIDTCEDMKLGIEALKRLQDNRRDPEFDHWIPLLGETEE